MDIMEGTTTLTDNEAQLLKDSFPCNSKDSNPAATPKPKQAWAVKREAVHVTAPIPLSALGRTFNVILADPPWRYDSCPKNRAVENHYPTMTLEEIKALKIPADKNAVLYLWATAPKLPEALKVIEAWGFTYKSQMCWNKELHGMGYWARGQHELLLIATKGKFSPPPQETRVGSVYSEKRTEHSKKPDYYRELIENQFPDGKFLELFARTKYSSKWTVWGNQVSDDDVEVIESEGLLGLSLD
jgi:N6-adenosine-specific RNA methylase IME4